MFWCATEVDKKNGYISGSGKFGECDVICKNLGKWGLFGTQSVIRIKTLLSTETIVVLDNLLQVSFKLLKRIQLATRLLDQMLIQPRGQTKGQTTVQMVHID